MERRRRLFGGRFVLPGVGLLGLVVACSFLGGRRPSTLDFALAAAVSLGLVAVSLSGRRVGLPGWQSVVPFGSFFVIALLRDGAGGTNSGFGALLLLPVLWIALHRGRAEVAAAIAAYALAQAVPIVAIGAPAYPPDWRRVLLSVTVAITVSVVVNLLVRDVALQHQGERERARAIIESQAHIAAAGLDAEAAMERIAERAMQLTGGTGAVVEMLDGDELVYTVATGILARFVSTRVSSASSLSGLAVVRNEVLTCDDSEQDDRVDREMCRRVGLRSMVVVPLRSQGAALGVLKVAAHVPAAFGPAQVETLEVLANVMSSGLANADAYARVAAANERLVEVDRMKDSFIATVSHELRTPLTSIFASAQMLADEDSGPLSSHQRMLVSLLERNANRLHGEIENLLAISRIEAGRFTSRLVPTELEPVLESVATELRPIADAGKVALDVNVFDGLGSIDADAGQLERAIVNLVSNAIKFTPPEGRVEIAARRADAAVEISVVDTGIGIPAEEQPRLFERFFRAAAADASAIQGSGLGLSIVKEIVDNHGGRVDVESEPGVGTRFTLVLPVARGASEQSPEPMHVTV